MPGPNGAEELVNAHRDIDFANGVEGQSPQERVKALQFLAKMSKNLSKKEQPEPNSEEKLAVAESLLEKDHPLQGVFDKCLHQLTKGKGEERHGQGKAFIDQPWKAIADVHGYGFLCGQAAKKLEEAQGFEDPDRWEREMLGVIVYAAMSVMHRDLERIPKHIEQLKREMNNMEQRFDFIDMETYEPYLELRKELTDLENDNG